MLSQAFSVREKSQGMLTEARYKQKWNSFFLGEYPGGSWFWSFQDNTFLLFSANQFVISCDFEEAYSAVPTLKVAGFQFLVAALLSVTHGYYLGSHPSSLVCFLLKVIIYSKAYVSGLKDMSVSWFIADLKCLHFHKIFWFITAEYLGEGQSREE